jgi:hypothetical protein
MLLSHCKCSPKRLPDTLSDATYRPALHKRSWGFTRLPEASLGIFLGNAEGSEALPSSDPQR